MNKIISMLAFYLLISGSAFAKDETNTFSKIYENDKEVVCGGKTYPIPTYFPTMSNTDGLYIDGGCHGNSIRVNIGFMKDCEGRNVCGFAGFYSEKATGNAIGLLEEIIADNQRIELESTETSTLEATYIPGKCYAYCNQSKLYWSTRDNTINVIQSKLGGELSEEGLKEYEKSAKSYLKNLKEFEEKNK
jgi:hypothetical protein